VLLTRAPRSIQQRIVSRGAYSTSLYIESPLPSHNNRQIQRKLRYNVFAGPPHHNNFHHDYGPQRPLTFCAIMEEFASQLTQELGGKNSQILALNSRAVAQDIRTAALEAELARQKDENARLRAQLKEAAAMSQSSVATTTTAPGVESQSQEVNTKDRQQIGGASSTDRARNDIAVFERAPPTPNFGGVNWQVNQDATTGSRPQQRFSLSGDKRSSLPTESTMKPRDATHGIGSSSTRRQTPDPKMKSQNWAHACISLSDNDDDDDDDPVPGSNQEKVPTTPATRGAGHDTTAPAVRKRRRAADVSPSPSSRVSENLHGPVVGRASQRPPTQLESLEVETTPAKRQRPTPASPYTPQKQTPAKAVQTPAKKRTPMPHPYTPLRVSPFQRLAIATPPSPSPPTQLPKTFRVPRSSGVFMAMASTTQWQHPPRLRANPQLRPPQQIVQPRLPPKQP
jgi:hypothetical protein